VRTSRRRRRRRRRAGVIVLVAWGVHVDVPGATSARIST